MSLKSKGLTIRSDGFAQVYGYTFLFDNVELFDTGGLWEGGDNSEWKALEPQLKLKMSELDTSMLMKIKFLLEEPKKLCWSWKWYYQVLSEYLEELGP